MARGEHYDKLQQFDHKPRGVLKFISLLQSFVWGIYFWSKEFFLSLSVAKDSLARVYSCNSHPFFSNFPSKPNICSSCLAKASSLMSILHISETFLNESNYYPICVLFAVFCCVFFHQAKQKRKNSRNLDFRMKSESRMI